MNIKKQFISHLLVFTFALADPDISVSPDSLLAELSAGEIDTISFTITNEGTGDLILEIEVQEVFGSVNFIKEAWADWTLPENQDRITDNVWITRADIRSLFNIAQEEEYDHTGERGSPVGTLWSDTITVAANFEDYTDFVTMHGNYAQNILGDTVSMYLVDENRYFDVFISTYSSGGGPFSYTRTEMTEVIPTWLGVSDTLGTISPGSSQNVSVTFDATGLNSGDRFAEIVITSNDPDEDVFVVSVTLAVTDNTDCTTGDIDADGNITVLDVIQCVNFVLNIVTPLEDQFCAADVDENDSVNVLDVISIMNMVLDQKIVSKEARAVLNENTLRVYGNIGGLQFDGILLSSVSGADIVVSANGITMIYNFSGSLETTWFELSSTSNLIVGTSAGTMVNVSVVDKFALLGNYPNPFNPTTVISFRLLTDNNIHLSIYDLRGRLVNDLVDGMIKAGHHEIQWNGQNMLGQFVSSGVYCYRLSTPKFQDMKKMVLLR